MHGKAKGTFSFPLAEGRLTQPGTCRFKNLSRRGVEAPLEHDDGVKDPSPPAKAEDVPAHDDEPPDDLPTAEKKFLDRHQRCAHTTSRFS